ncbi:hypothetical protein NQ318_021709 [Aromia moschata]|uniref:NR LBD domain-containing protein n=1 Tax=Aromia moschata TaxID=1265417 RepID=A0AAV8XHF1_9CUCU|nr:hypothetical protein NQ318_021709 [Aromia moschata]
MPGKRHCRGKLFTTLIESPFAWDEVEESISAISSTTDETGKTDPDFNEYSDLVTIWSFESDLPVRYGRVPKRSRERSVEEHSRVTTSDPDQSDAETKQLAVYDVILTVSQAHHANCGYTEEHTRNLVRKPIILPPASPSEAEGPEVASSTADSREAERCWLWQQFAANITPSVQRVVEFAKRVPGFCDFSQDDQLILIKVGFFEIWLSHAARLTSSASLMFDDGTTVTRQQLEAMYDARARIETQAEQDGTAQSEFTSSVIHFAGTFNALSLNDTEVGLFSAVVLLTADRPGITDVKAIEHHQDRLIEALKVQVSVEDIFLNRNVALPSRKKARAPTNDVTAPRQSVDHGVSRNHANEPQIFSNLLIKLPELRNLGARHTAHLDWFRVNWTKLTLPPLFAEIFDIPKSEDDLQ